jgi:integrase
MQIRLQHLVWHNNCYHFRYAIQSDIRGYMGRREFKRSLHTAVPLEAQAAARHLAGMVERHLTFIRKVVGSDMDEQRKKDFIQRFVLTRMQADLHWHEDFRTHRDPITPQQAELELAQTQAWLAELKGQLARNDLSTLQSMVRGFARTHFPEEAGEFLGEPAALKKLTREVQKARIRMAKIEVERAKGNYDNEYDAVPLVAPAPEKAIAIPTLAGTAAAITLRKATDAYVADKMTAKAWSNTTKLEYVVALQLLLEYFGDVDLTAFSHLKLKAFRDSVLTKVPSNRTKMPAYREAKLADLLEMDIPAEDRFSLNSINKYMQRIGGLFVWAHKHTYIPSNFAEGLLFENTRSPQEERAVYTKDNLQAMVIALADVPRQPRAWRFWSPLIALYTGMRLNEIGQLLVSDIVKIEGVWCIDVNSKGEGKKVKTKAAKRLIPVHSKLMGLGFLDYVEGLRIQRKARLWPDLPLGPDGYGHSMSRWYARWRKKWLTKKDLEERRDFHSLRHTFDNALKQAGLLDVRLPELMGHSLGKDQTFGRYGKPTNPKMLQEAIEKLDHGLDLSPLKAGPASAAADDDPT